MTTVVLGWDGLDPDRVQQFGLADAFGSSWTSIDTIRNPVLEKPHTYELWPSLITGRPPSGHGIHADEYIESGWESRMLTLAAQYSRLVPDRVRWRVGRLLRDHGAEYAFETPDYYADRGIRTLFDGRQSIPLAIPNYRSQVDDHLGISMDRGAALADYLDVDTAADGSTVHRPSVDAGTLAMRLAGEAGEKLAATMTCLHQQPDLVFVWLGYLDTVGHVAPTLADPRVWVEHHYEQAAHWTCGVRDQLTAADDLVCVSDHGLQDGGHTDRAVVAGTVDVSGCEHLLDVHDLVDRIAPATDGAARGFAPGEAAAYEAVADDLEALGYL